MIIRLNCNILKYLSSINLRFRPYDWLKKSEDGCNHPSYSTLAMNDASATGLGKSGHCYLLQRDSLCCWLFVEECQIKETTVAFSCWLELEKNTDKNAPYKKHGHSGSCCFLQKVSVSLLTLIRRTTDNNALIKKEIWSWKLLWPPTL